MMDGRVKTLHPRIHGGILARRASDAHLAAAREHGIGLIDVVAVNLYPFAAAAANPATPFDGLVEEIDIGGPSLVRGAAKNFADVLVVVSPADYAAVLEELDRPGGPSPLFRFDLARKAFAHTGAYDTAIAATLADVTVEEGRFARPPAGDARCAVAADGRPAQGPRPPLRREPAPAGGVVRGRAAGGARRGRRSSRARNCRTRTCWTSMPPRASCSSSASRPPP